MNNIVSARVCTSGPEWKTLKDQIDKYFTGKWSFRKSRKGFYAKPEIDVLQCVEIVHQVYELEAAYVSKAMVREIVISYPPDIHIIIRRPAKNVIQKSASKT